MTKSTSVGRLGTAEEVANTVLYLVSDNSGFIMAETIGVSGGMGCGLQFNTCQDFKPGEISGKLPKICNIFKALVYI